MTTRLLVIAAFAVLVVLPAAAQRKAPPAAAIVEDLDARVKGAELLAYVETGHRIDASGGTVVLNYLASCVRETITGGTLVVGERESTVTGGQVKRDTLAACDSGKLVLRESEGGKSGAMVFRKGGNQQGRATLPKPEIVIYGSSPIITPVEATDIVLIERLDVQGSIMSLHTSKGKVDLAAEGKQLEPGGLYKARAGAAEMVFLVDSAAKPGNAPPAARLLRF